MSERILAGSSNGHKTSVARVVSIVIAAALFTVVVLFTLYRRERSLLDSALCMMSDRSGKVEDYVWVSEHALVYEVRGDTGNLKTMLFDSISGAFEVPNSDTLKAAHHQMIRIGIARAIRLDTLAGQFMKESGVYELPFVRSVIDLPEGTRAVEYDRELIGGRIVWLLKREPSNFWVTVVHVFRPGYKGPAIDPILEMWVSRANGNDFRMLGRVGASSQHNIRGIEWTSSGRRVSFLCSHSLYTVPTD